MRDERPEVTKSLRPAEGRRVRKPDTGLPLDEAGELVEMSPYWRRRLDDGDVVDIDEAEAQATAQAAAEARAAARAAKKES